MIIIRRNLSQTSNYYFHSGIFTLRRYDEKYRLEIRLVRMVTVRVRVNALVIEIAPDLHSTTA